MKASELRIGNYINRPDLGDGHLRTESILAIYERVKTTGPIKTIFDFQDIHPIPLTEEWLLKFGFGKSEDHEVGHNTDLNFNFYYDWHFKRFRIESGFNSDNDWIVPMPHIQYVHQLQNLYFALTGKEL